MTTALEKRLIAKVAKRLRFSGPRGRLIVEALSICGLAYSVREMAEAKFHDWRIEMFEMVCRSFAVPAHLMGAP